MNDINHYDGRRLCKVTHLLGFARRFDGSATEKFGGEAVAVREIVAAASPLPSLAGFHHIASLGAVTFPEPPGCTSARNGVFHASGRESFQRGRLSVRWWVQVVALEFTVSTFEWSR